MKKNYVIFLSLLIVLICSTIYLGSNVTIKEEKQFFAYEEAYGKYEISYLNGDEYVVIDTIAFGKNPKELNLKTGLLGDVTIRIRKISGGLGFIDYINVDNQPVITDDGYINKKLSKYDLDVLEITYEGLEISFSKLSEGNLTMVALIEPVVIVGDPFLLDAKKADGNLELEGSYILNSNYSTLEMNTVTSNLDINNSFKTYDTLPHSGHPTGKAYIWVYNDDEYLYVMSDWTTDNTYDYGKDFFKVHVGTSDGIKTYTQYSNRGDYGESFFDYTNTVIYEHMQYKIRIPLSEINQDQIDLGFELYGTGCTAIQWNGEQQLIAEAGDEIDFYLLLCNAYTFTDLLLFDVTGSDNPNSKIYYDSDLDKLVYPESFKLLAHHAKTEDTNTDEEIFEYVKIYDAGTREIIAVMQQPKSCYEETCHVDLQFSQTHEIEITEKDIISLEDNDIKINSLNSKTLNGLYFKAQTLDKSSILTNQELENKINDLTNKKVIEILDFSLYNSNDDTKIEDFNGYEFEIIIPLDKYGDYTDLELFYIDEEGELTLLEKEVTKDGLKVKLNHLSEYGLLGFKIDKVNPPTGDINGASIGMVLIISITGFLIILKEVKKYKIEAQ